MDGLMPTSPEFRADPLGWVQRMCAQLMCPGVRIGQRDRDFVVRKRERYHIGTAHKPGPVLYDQLCRIARRAGVIRERAPLGTKGSAERVRRAAQVAAVPARFAVGAPIPPPPPLRRPAVALYDGRPETWDPAGAPGP